MQELTFEQVEEVSGGSKNDKSDDDSGKTNSYNSMCYGAASAAGSILTCIHSNGNVTVSTCVGPSSLFLLNFCNTVENSESAKNEDLKPVGSYWGV